MTPEPEKPQASRVTSLAELQAMCEKKVIVRFDFDGQKIEIETYRLIPQEDAVIDEILTSVMPPLIKGKTPEEDRHDYTNAEYIRRKTLAEIEARALAIYWRVPMFKAEKPDLRDRSEIVSFVQSKLNNQILGLLWQAVRNGGVSLAELVNFT